MSNPLPLKMTPEDEVFTFRQGSGETFKDAWARIMRSYEKTEPRITLSILLSNFYFGLMLCYRYALDTIVGGDFLRHNGDQAFNAIKSLIATSSSDNKIESTFENIANKLDALYKNISSMKGIGSMVQELHESAFNRAPRNYFGTRKCYNKLVPLCYNRNEWETF